MARASATPGAELRQWVDDVADAVKSVEMVAYGHVEGVVVVLSSLYPRTWVFS